MPKITGIKAVEAALKKQARKKNGQYDKNVSVVVGYKAAYAIYVHENLEMKLQGLPRANGKGNYWDPQGKGQSKFLEQPAREMKDELGAIATRAVSRGATLLEGLYLAGLALQRKSQQLVPIDTGNLKASAFTEKE